jgi:methylmalonyl-CoA/ethylmalonyl-CoA epimerase
MPAESPVEGLHHIGIAVRSIAEALPRWTDEFGLRLERIEDVPQEKVRVAVLRAGTTRIELLEPLAADSPVVKFLDKRGPGIHHLAFRVRDCQDKIDDLASRGAPMINTTPNRGAHDCMVAFVHPKWLGGVLAELVEDPHHG